MSDRGGIIWKYFVTLIKCLQETKKKQQNLNLCVLIIERCWRNKLLIHERTNGEAYCNRNVFKKSNNQVLMSNNPKLGDNNEEKTRIMRKDEQHNNFHNNSTTI